jgi:exopolysaccharide biosynthesis polyprenyl glycosylphosphotransferase
VSAVDPGGGSLVRTATVAGVGVQSSRGVDAVPRRRGVAVRRALVMSDILGLTVAFLISTLGFADPARASDMVGPGFELMLFVLTLPLWTLLANAHGLYARDEDKVDHSTADEILGVVQLVTLGTWVLFVAGWATGLADPDLDRLVALWALALGLLTSGRVAARALCRRSAAYTQNAVILGAGHVGQLVARKLLQHPEYGVRLVGFVDEDPRARRMDIGDLPVLGGPHDLPGVVAEHRVERVIVAFSGDPDQQTMALVRSLRDREVIVDVVPRLFELIGPRAHVHAIEGLPLVTVPPARLSSLSGIVKRVIDVAVAAIVLIMAAPFFAYAAIRIKRGSPGPVFFRQTRLGTNMRAFTALKFRTMKVDTDDAEHRDFIRKTMSSDAAIDGNGMYKLSRENAITQFGSWLRKTSLDELPQLLNVLRGDMSLVGPRPCIPYETEYFEPHHFDRFLVPQGVTGLWQVTARANSTFGEALEMDVAYVRGWTLGLDLRLIFKTPFALLRQRGSTA